MQRALGASEPPGTPVMKLQASPNKVTTPANAPKKETPQLDKTQKIYIPTTGESKRKETTSLGSPQRKPPTTAEQSTKAEIMKGSKSEKKFSPAPGWKTPQEEQKTGPQKLLDQTNPTGHKQSNTTSTTQKEPGESLGGKMFGFGSSIFSSASTLINSAVQDDSKVTPVSPEVPVAKAGKTEQEKKLDQLQQPKTSPLLQTKVEKAPSEHAKDADASPGVPKAAQSTCPLCKVELNFGSKEPSNYKNCTECKNIVCNQCGFNPMPNVSEVRKSCTISP